MRVSQEYLKLLPFFLLYTVLVFLAKDNIAKLGDFGAAKKVASLNSSPSKEGIN